MLSYAEVKALATGSPLVIEQAGIQAELAKLERLAVAHRHDGHRLTRTAANALAEAARLQARAATLQSAIARRVDTSGDRFAMEIDGTHHSSRIEAGHALLERARALTVTIARRRGDYEAPTRIGRLGGFPLDLDGYQLAGTVEARLALVLDGTHPHTELVGALAHRAGVPTDLGGRPRRRHDGPTPARQRP